MPNDKHIIEKYFGIDREAAQKLIDDTLGKKNDRSGDNSFQSTKVYLTDEYAILRMNNIIYRNVIAPDHDLHHLAHITQTLLELYAQGVHVVPIVGFQCDGENGCIIQRRAPGSELYDRGRLCDKDYILSRVFCLSNAPQAHYDKFVADAVKIMNAGILIDFVGKDNFFYDETTGFHFIDLSAHFDYVYGLADEKPNVTQIAAWNCFLPCYFDPVPQHRDNVSQVLSVLNRVEQSLLQESNKRIFDKCIFALLHNGITADIVDEIITDSRFIPQRQQLKLPLTPEKRSDIKS